ncbi:MAG: hypothetical protein AB8B52_05535 [Winogradskyella sp.]|uniref:hypothetical protein n=1 Tax=Winogradskyella sp. TaxID=1883156 RepID=UPI003858A19C
MKTKGIILILAVLLFSSCIVKSLQPFYTKDSLSFNEKLLGNWVDQKKGVWTIESMRAKFEEDRNPSEVRSKEDLIAFEAYKDGYYVTYIKNEKQAGFIAMPFKIDQHYFMDFIPLEIEDDEINSLAAEHLLKTHSVSKLDMTSDEELSLSWLSEERLKDLFEGEKIRIKHEKIGPEDTLLLTASSEELYAFLTKYVKAGLFESYEKKQKKWKSSDQLTLAKVDAKP